MRIWVVVVDGVAYVRSVRGDRGHWFQAAVENPDEVALRVHGKVIPVRVTQATDEHSISQCSSGLQTKYPRTGSSLASMLRPNTLETTLVLEPR